MQYSYSLIIIGGGIVGITLAREAAISRKFGKILILEKESDLGTHASSRNSGVIHSGFYYAPNSQKALFCSEANKLMRDYCVKNNLNLRKCGKVVVENSIIENKILNELYERGQKNGCDIYLLNKKDLNHYEPLAKTKNQFIWSPNTWSISPKDLISSLKEELKNYKVDVLINKKIVEFHNSYLVDEDLNHYKFEYLINSAGAYSLNIAEKMKISTNYKLLPFKGLYLKSKKKLKNYNCHIYPVPNINQPFLGIHTTLTSDYYLKLGPTALPVFSPENYTLLEGIDFEQVFNIIFNQLTLFINNEFGYRDLAFEEIKYLIKNNIIKEAQKLTYFNLKNIEFEWHTPGIRAQLYNVLEKKLEMDFVYKELNNQFHILNSISPAWTCSFKTAKFIINKITK